MLFTLSARPASPRIASGRPRATPGTRSRGGGLEGADLRHAGPRTRQPFRTAEPDFGQHAAAGQRRSPFGIVVVREAGAARRQFHHHQRVVVVRRERASPGSCPPASPSRQRGARWARGPRSGPGGSCAVPRPSGSTPRGTRCCPANKAAGVHVAFRHGVALRREVQQAKLGARTDGGAGGFQGGGVAGGRLGPESAAAWPSPRPRP